MSRATTIVNEQTGKIKMRKYVVMFLVAGLMAFGVWLPSAAFARPPQGSQARCFDNYAACYQNSGKCIFPGQCRAKCEQKYSACSAVATSGGWSSRGGCNHRTAGNRQRDNDRHDFEWRHARIDARIAGNGQRDNGRDDFDWRRRARVDTKWQVAAGFNIRCQ